MIGVAVNPAQGGRGIEESLEEVVQQMDANLERVKQQHRQSASRSSAGWTPAASVTEASFDPSSSVRSMGGSARPQSASRVPPQRLSQSIQQGGNPTTSRPVMQSHQQSLPISANQAPVTGNGINYLRKIQLLEEKIKRMEKNQSSDEQTIQDLSNKCELLLETHRQEKRNYHGIKEQLASYKTRLDVLSNQEEFRGKIATGHPLGLDSDMLQEIISEKIKREVARAMEDASLHRQFHSETISAADKLLKSANQTTTDRFIESQRGQRQLSDQMASVEREMIRVSSEFDRLKTKHNYLDRVYSDLKDSVSIKELKMEEHHRKAIHSYRHEFDQLMQSTTRQLNELQTTKEEKTVQVEDVQKAMETHIENTGAVLAEFDMRFLRLEETLQQVGSTAALLKSKEKDLESRVRDLEGQFPQFFVELQEIQRVKDHVHQLGDKLNQQQDCYLEVTLQIKEIRESIDAFSGPLTLLSTSLDQMGERLDKKLVKLVDSISQTNKEHDTALQQVRDQMKRYKAKVKDVHTQVTAVKEQGEQVAVLLQQLEAQRVDEAQSTYEVHTQLQRIVEEQRQQQVQLQGLQDEDAHCLQQVQHVADEIAQCQAGMEDIQRDVASIRTDQETKSQEMKEGFERQFIAQRTHFTGLFAERDDMQRQLWQDMLTSFSDKLLLEQISPIEQQSHILQDVIAGYEERMVAQEDFAREILEQLDVFKQEFTRLLVQQHEQQLQQQAENEQAHQRQMQEQLRYEQEQQRIAFEQQRRQQLQEEQQRNFASEAAEIQRQAQEQAQRRADEQQLQQQLLLQTQAKPATTQSFATELERLAASFEDEVDEVLAAAPDVLTVSAPPTIQITQPAIVTSATSPVTASVTVPEHSDSGTQVEAVDLYRTLEGSHQAIRNKSPINFDHLPQRSLDDFHSIMSQVQHDIEAFDLRASQQYEGEKNRALHQEETPRITQDGSPHREPLNYAVTTPPREPPQPLPLPPFSASPAVHIHNRNDHPASIPHDQRQVQDQQRQDHHEQQQQQIHHHFSQSHSNVQLQNPYGAATTDATYYQHQYQGGIPPGMYSSSLPQHQPSTAYPMPYPVAYPNVGYPGSVPSHFGASQQHHSLPFSHQYPHYPQYPHLNHYYGPEGVPRSQSPSRHSRSHPQPSRHTLHTKKTKRKAAAHSTTMKHVHDEDDDDDGDENEEEREETDDHRSETASSFASSAGSSVLSRESNTSPEPDRDTKKRAQKNMTSKRTSEPPKVRAVQKSSPVSRRRTHVEEEESVTSARQVEEEEGFDKEFVRKDSKNRSKKVDPLTSQGQLKRKPTTPQKQKQVQQSPSREQQEIVTKQKEEKVLEHRQSASLSSLGSHDHPRSHHGHHSHHNNPHSQSRQSSNHSRVSDEEDEDDEGDGEEEEGEESEEGSEPDNEEGHSQDEARGEEEDDHDSASEEEYLRQLQQRYREQNQQEHDLDTADIDDGEEEEEEAELDETQIMQALMEQRRRLRQQLRPELFGDGHQQPRSEKHDDGVRQSDEFDYDET